MRAISPAVLLLVVSMLLGGPGLVPASPAVPQDDDTWTASRVIALAYELERWGSAHDSASALALAAELLASVRVEPGPESAGPAGDGAGAHVLRPGELTARAEELDGTRRGGPDRMGDARTATAKGGSKSASQTTGVVERGSRKSYSLSVRAGQTVHVHLQPDGEADLDLWVYDYNNDLLASDTRFGADLPSSVSFRAPYTGRVSVDVVNEGIADSYFVLYW